jgi:hypothetical protein
MDWDKLVLEKTISNLQHRIAKATERGEAKYAIFNDF